MDLLKYSIPNFIFGIIMMVYPIALIFMSRYMIFAPILFIILSGIVDLIIVGLFIFFMFRFNKSIRKNYRINLTRIIATVVVLYFAMMMLIIVIRCLYAYDLAMLTVSMILLCETIFLGVALCFYAIKLFKIRKFIETRTIKRGILISSFIIGFSGIAFISIIGSILGPILLGLSFIQMGYIFYKIK